MTAGTAQSVKQLAMGWMVWGLKAGGVQIFLVPIQIDPEAHPDLCTKSTRSFLG